MDNKVIGFVEEWEAFGFNTEEEFDKHINLTKEEHDYLLTLPAAKRTRDDLTYGKDYVYQCFQPAEGTGKAMLEEGECVYTTPSEDDYKELQRINDELEKNIVERIVKKLKDSDI